MKWTRNLWSRSCLMIHNKSTGTYLYHNFNMSAMLYTGVILKHVFPLSAYLDGILIFYILYTYLIVSFYFVLMVFSISVNHLKLILLPVEPKILADLFNEVDQKIFLQNCFKSITWLKQENWKLNPQNKYTLHWVYFAFFGGQKEGWHQK